MSQLCFTWKGKYVLIFLSFSLLLSGSIFHAVQCWLKISKLIILNSQPERVARGVAILSLVWGGFLFSAHFVPVALVNFI